MKEKLRFKTDTTFEEADPPEDRSRPLEWRRAFNLVSMTVRTLVVDQIYSINDADLFGSILNDDEVPGESGKSAPVKPGIKRRRRITGTVAGCRDSLYYAKESEKGSDIHGLHRPAGQTRVILIEREASTGDSVYMPGAYPGSLFLDDFEAGTDHFCFELSVPTNFMEELVAELRREPLLGLAIDVTILSFTYEVDDFLREWYHPRNLFIHGTHAPSPLANVRTLPLNPSAESAELQEILEEEDESTPQLNDVPPVPTVQTSRPPWRSIRLALWAIAAILLLHLFK